MRCAWNEDGGCHAGDGAYDGISDRRGGGTVRDNHGEGEKKDFFNEQDRLHMADVKNLFLGGLKVRTACLMLALVLLAILILTSADWKV